MDKTTKTIAVSMSETGKIFQDVAKNLYDTPVLKTARNFQNQFSNIAKLSKPFIDAANISALNIQPVDFESEEKIKIELLDATCDSIIEIESEDNDLVEVQVTFKVRIL